VCTSHFVVMFNCGGGFGEDQALVQCLYLPVNKRLEVIVERACKMYSFSFEAFCLELVTIPMVIVFSFPSNHFKYALCMYCLVHG
jgi:hypothetical protein